MIFGLPPVSFGEGKRDEELQSTTLIDTPRNLGGSGRLTQPLRLSHADSLYPTVR
jgi:hypothetical protein